LLQYSCFKKQKQLEKQKRKTKTKFLEVLIEQSWGYYLLSTQEVNKPILRRNKS